MSAFCRGRTADGGDCDCEQYSPPDEGLLRCAECDHGKSKHPNTHLPATNLPATNLPATNLSDKQNVLKLFQNMTKKSGPVFEQAKTETLRNRAPRSTKGKVKSLKIILSYHL